MNAIAILVTTAALSVDYGWHRGPDGEWEYIIQIEPALVDTLSRGQALVSQMPPELRGVRRFRIQIGQGEVPRDQLPVGGILNVASPGGAAAGLSPNGLSPGSFASGGFGGPNASNSPGASGWHGANHPPDPGSYAYRNFDWIRYEPIRVDPLENSFLTDLRNRGMEIGPSPTHPPAFLSVGANGIGGNSLGSNGFGSSGLGGTGFGAGGLGTGGLGNSNWNRTGPGNFASQPGSGGFGPDPSPFDLQRQRSSFDGPPPESGRFSLPNSGGFSNGANGAWPPATAPGGFGNPSDFDLPERPRLDMDQANGSDPGRRFRLNDDRTTASRGFTASLPNANSVGNRSRTPSVSLSTPDRGRLPGDDLDRDSHVTGTSTAKNSNERAHAEITRTAANRTTATNTATEKMWWPLTTTVLLLFGSLGGNVYLGWLAMDFYRRYRETAWELRTGN